jgi:hypothetical protein
LRGLDEGYQHFAFKDITHSHSHATNMNSEKTREKEDKKNLYSLRLLTLQCHACILNIFNTILSQMQTQSFVSRAVSAYHVVDKTCDVVDKALQLGTGSSFSAYDSANHSADDSTGAGARGDAYGGKSSDLESPSTVLSQLLNGNIAHQTSMPYSTPLSSLHSPIPSNTHQTNITASVMEVVLVKRILRIMFFDLFLHNYSSASHKHTNTNVNVNANVQGQLNVNQNANASSSKHHHLIELGSYCRACSLLCAKALLSVSLLKTIDSKYLSMFCAFSAKDIQYNHSHLVTRALILLTKSSTSTSLTSSPTLSSHSSSSAGHTAAKSKSTSAAGVVGHLLSHLPIADTFADTAIGLFGIGNHPTDDSADSNDDVDATDNTKGADDVDSNNGNIHGKSNINIRRKNFSDYNNNSSDTDDDNDAANAGRLAMQVQSDKAIFPPNSTVAVASEPLSTFQTSGALTARRNKREQEKEMMRMMQTLLLDQQATSMPNLIVLYIYVHLFIFSAINLKI